MVPSEYYHVEEQVLTQFQSLRQLAIDRGREVFGRVQELWYWIIPEYRLIESRSSKRTSDGLIGSRFQLDSRSSCARWTEWCWRGPQVWVKGFGYHHTWSGLGGSSQWDKLECHCLLNQSQMFNLSYFDKSVTTCHWWRLMISRFGG